MGGLPNGVGAHGEWGPISKAAVLETGDVVKEFVTDDRNKQCGP